MPRLSMLVSALALSLFACDGGGSEDVCDQAAAHVLTCTGEALTRVDSACDSAAARTTLGMDCADLNGEVAGGKSDGAWDSAATFMCTRLGFDSYCPGMSIAAGFEHTCGLRSSGAVSCWGSNLYGQVGARTPRPQDEPVTLDLKAKAVAPGVFHTCAIGLDGQVSCWGLNQGGELGVSRYLETRHPQLIKGASGASQLVSGNGFSCMLASSGRVSCWGGNNFGTLGNGRADDGDYPTPTEVARLTDVVQLSAGWHHVCARHRDGGVSCWGSNYNGECAQPEDLHEITKPVRIAGVTSVAQVAASQDKTCAVTSGGSLTCWGRNAFGELGLPRGASETIPPTVVPGMTDVVEAVAGNVHTCVRHRTGAVTCFGHGGFGRIGNGQASNGAVAPAAVAGLTDATALAAGGEHTCARRKTGAFVCWGRGDQGQLGQAEVTNASRPSAVVGF